MIVDKKNSFNLTFENFKETTLGIQEYLEELKLPQNEIMNGLLMIEEIFLRFRRVQKDFQAEIKIKKRFGNVLIVMQSEGAPYDPLESLNEWDDNEENYYNTIILKAHKLRLAYSRKNLTNIVSIAVHTSKNMQIKYTLCAMVLGILTGIIFKEFMPAEAINFFEKNIIFSIRTMFLNALNMMIAPVVFFSIIAGLTSMVNASDIGRIGGKLILIYMFTTLLATIFGMSLSLFLFRGGLPQIGVIDAAAAGAVVRISVIDMIVGIVPENLINPIVKRDMLQIIFMAFLFGITINILGEKARRLSDISEVLNTFNLKIISMLAKFVPLIAFLSMASLIFKLGVESLYLLVKVIIGQSIGAVLMAIVYSTVLVILGKISPMPFLRKIISFLPIPASMGSSTATMPFTMNFCTEKMGVAQNLSSFSIPLGATINMDGTCFYFSIFTIMIAKMYGVEINSSFLCSLFIAILALSIGAPGVPGGVFVCLTSIIVSFGIPVEAAAFALGIEPLVSIFRMTVNIVGDIAVTTALAKNEKLLDEKVYLSRN